MHSKTFLTALVAIIVMGFLGTTAAWSAGPAEPARAPRRPGTVLFKVKDHLTAEQRSALATVRRNFALQPAKRLVKGRIEHSQTVAAAREEELCAQLRATGAVEFAELDYLIPPALTPNDTSYPAQWHHTMINSPWAWDISTGATTVLAAVCDTGVQADHPDLAAHLDLALARNVVDGSNDVTDTFGHGTTCTGVLGAIGNNSLGVAGLAWNVRILPIKISNRSDGSAYAADITEAITYAADCGARVVSVSYSAANSLAIDSAAQYLRSKGGLLFAAAGNHSSYQDWHDLPATISVGASEENDLKAGYSDWGPYIDVVAPGSNIWTTRTGSDYGTPTGTSNAAPLVAGLAALLFALDPSFTPEQVENYIESRTAGLGRLIITCSAALDPATVGPAALAIAGQLSGDQSSRLASVTLTAGNTVLIAQLSSPLPDGDRYTFTLSQSVKFADGGSVSGGGVRHMSALVGDADASGQVDAGDLLAIRGAAGQTLAEANAGCDVNCSGTVSAADLSAARRNLGHALP